MFSSWRDGLSLRVTYFLFQACLSLAPQSNNEAAHTQRIQGPSPPHVSKWRCQRQQHPLLYRDQCKSNEASSTDLSRDKWNYSDSCNPRLTSSTWHFRCSCEISPSLPTIYFLVFILVSITTVSRRLYRTAAWYSGCGTRCWCFWVANSGVEIWAPPYVVFFWSGLSFRFQL